MFILKKKYFLIIESIKDIDLSNIKKINKFNIIYRNKCLKDNLNEIVRFRKMCNSKKIGFFISNRIKLAHALKADGVYISANNNNLGLVHLKYTNFKVIGAAHNLKELKIKILQRCSFILYSRLFKTSYKFKKGHLGILRFNQICKSLKKNLVPLGGISLSNLNKLKLINSDSFAILSAVKKKPAIISRLF